MAIRGTYDAIKQAIQDLIAPQLERIGGEIAGLKAEVHSLEKRMEEGQTLSHQEIGSLREEVRQGQASLRGELGSFREEIHSLREEMRQGQASFRGELGSLREEMHALREEMRQGLAYTNKRLDETAEIRERLAALEAKFAARN